MAATSHSLPAALLYLVFSPVCHQMAHRSFVLAGHALGVCQRCSGIYAGLFLGSLVPPGNYAKSGPEGRRLWVICASVPIVADALLPFTGMWTNTPFSRFSTGMLFGSMAATLLLPGITEVLRHSICLRTVFRASHVKGDVS